MDAVRKFRNNRENMRDTRISYLFLLSLAFICTITGLVLNRFENKASAAEISVRYRTLTQCADALIAWETADNDADRYTASLRFENAAAGLPSQVELEPLYKLAGSMRDGNADVAHIRALADTFSMLSAVEYPNEAEARDSIGKTLNGVNHLAASDSLEAAVIPPPEVLSYTRKVAEKSVHGIFDGHEGAMEPELTEDGGSWAVLADNVRMSFDSQTGSLEAFVFLRIGAVSDSALSEDELVETAREFYCANRRRDGGVEAKIETEICGFSAVDITDGSELWRVCIDSHGQVWSLVKVKR